MNIKTSELAGAALDWAVAKCEVYPISVWYDEDELPMVRDDEVPEWQPSTEWAQGGPIIEREWLDITPWPNESDEELQWQCKQHDSIDCVAFGPTPLIAAMRCYVASKLGDEVEIPAELTGETA
jgi:hypothetical protein